MEDVSATQTAFNMKAAWSLACLVAYLLLGAAILQQMERPHELEQRQEFQALWSGVSAKLSPSERDSLDKLLSRLPVAAAEPHWSFLGSLFFCLGLVTTIGYGNFYPELWYGRLFVMLYSSVGLLGVGYVLSLLAEHVLRSLAKIVGKVRERYGQGDFETEYQQGKTRRRHQVYLSFAVVFILLVAGGAVFSKVEGWNFFNGLYFCFLTLSTIGLGDFAPTSVVGQMLAVVFILVGLGSLAFLLNALSQLFQARIERAVQKAAWRRHSVHLKDVLVRQGDSTSEQEHVEIEMVAALE